MRILRFIRALGKAIAAFFRAREERAMRCEAGHPALKEWDSCPICSTGIVETEVPKVGDEPPVVALRIRDGHNFLRMVALRPGTYTVGRAATTDIVLTPDNHYSRNDQADHAESEFELTVQPKRVEIEVSKGDQRVRIADAEYRNTPLYDRDRCILLNSEIEVLLLRGGSHATFNG